MKLQSGPNEDQARYWNGPDASKWLVDEDRHERMLAPFTGRVLDAAAVAPGDRVLDVGCGTGSTTCAAARAAGEGRALGVDISAQLLRRGEERGRQDGLTNVRFEQGDAQIHPLAPGGFDVAISRFGVMFFADPAAAFANIASGLRPGGRLVFVCWQRLVDNQWVTVPGAAAARYVPLPPRLAPGNPGPFSLGEQDRLRAVLDAAGLVDVALEPVTESPLVGRDAADAVGFFLATGPGQALLRDADPTTVDRVTAAMQAALEPYQTADGVRLGARSWLVRARTPG
jgi:SAM-dependent methyltransferase